MRLIKMNTVNFCVYCNKTLRNGINAYQKGIITNNSAKVQYICLDCIENE